MVFSGRPSKACQRCRTRRLKCDLYDPCGQCVRASAVCSGYSHIKQLRIRDQTHSVHLKALSKAKIVSAPEPFHVPLSLDSRARNAFYEYYVSGPAKTWNVLWPFYSSTDSPEYLTLAIDAVSLAYLSHQVSSKVALTASRERYVSALRLTSKAIQSPEVISKDTILLTSLLLDIFEKITNTNNQLFSSWSSHVKGALTLVRLRGLDDFRDLSALQLLVRLSTNFLISSVATNSPVPDELSVIREHARKYLGLTDDPKFRMSDLMIEYANVRSRISSGLMSSEAALRKCLELDVKFQGLMASMPPSWRYEKVVVEHPSDTIYDDYFHVYPERHITQVWNVIRFVRILLNEVILSFGAQTPASSSVTSAAKENITTSAQDICASIPQYLNSSSSPSKVLDCYSLILPLYVAAQTPFAPEGIKAWTMKQLGVMSDECGIKNAGLVRNVLRESREREIDTWAIYAMLGSYAFAA